MIQSVTLQDVIDFRNKLLSQYKPTSAARKLSLLRNAYEYFVDAGIVSRNPFKNKFVKNPKVPTEGVTQSLTQKEAELLLKQPRRDTLLGKRNCAILTLMLHNGLRRSEVTDLKISNLKTEGCFHVLEVWGKGAKLRIAKLKPQVREAIQEYIKAKGGDSTPEEYLFKSHSLGMVKWQKQNHKLTGEAIRQMIQKYAKRAGIEKHVHPHQLRSTFTTLAIEGGAKIHQVQAALGHSDPKTTMRYFKSQEALADNATDYVHLLG